MLKRLTSFMNPPADQSTNVGGSKPAPQEGSTPKKQDVGQTPQQSTPPPSNPSQTQESQWSASKMKTSLMVTLGLQTENPDAQLKKFDEEARQSFAQHALSNLKHTNPKTHDEIVKRPPEQNFVGVTMNKRTAFAPDVVSKLPDPSQPQHAYLETPVNGKTSGRGKGPDIAEKGIKGGDKAVYIEGSGPYEKEIMEKMKKIRDDDGPWIGFGNDCHNTVERATEDVLPKPPAVGRFGSSVPKGAREVTKDNMSEFANPAMRYAIDSGKLEEAAKKLNE